MHTPNHTTTEALMARFIAADDVAAFEAVVDRCLPPALGVARQLLSDASLAEDAVQEALLRVVRRRGAYIAGRPFLSWFLTVLRNVCLDMLRSRARQAKLLQEAAACRPVAAQTADGGRDAADVLGVLPTGERDVLTLRIVHELSFREVGVALGITEEAAKKRAQRGLRRLRRKRGVLGLLRRAVVGAGASA